MNDKRNQVERSRTILVVGFDDNSYLLRRLLEIDGLQVEAVANGAEALKALEQIFPDLILTDWIMPKIGGGVLMHYLKQNEYTSLIPVIAVTEDNTSMWLEAYVSGAKEIITRPINYYWLSASIKKLLRITSIKELPEVTLLGKRQTEAKPDDKLILPVKQSIVVVNEQLADIFRSDPESLRRIDPFKFENVVAELFQDEGYKVILTPARADGGKDLYFYKKDPLTEVMFLVECKRYIPPNKVDVSVARQLFGVVQQERASGGIIVTTSYFTKPAKEFAASVPYHLFLRDFDYLTQWLKKTK